jgi:hypothetical protein
MGGAGNMPRTTITKVIGNSKLITEGSSRKNPESLHHVNCQYAGMTHPVLRQ